MHYLSRIVSLKSFDNVLLGRDLSEQLEPGMIYGIRKLMGVITLEPIGKHAQSKLTDENRTINQIATEGVYCLTQQEYMDQLKREEQ